MDDNSRKRRSVNGSDDDVSKRRKTSHEIDTINNPVDHQDDVTCDMMINAQTQLHHAFDGIIHNLQEELENWMNYALIVVKDLSAAKQRIIALEETANDKDDTISILEVEATRASFTTKKKDQNS
ncbi:hypothetical protein ACHQM5_002388 [Ranunculus cassubicifolius]